MPFLSNKTGGFSSNGGGGFLSDSSENQSLTESDLQQLYSANKTPSQPAWKKIVSVGSTGLQKFSDFISTPRYAIGGLLTGQGISGGIKNKTNPSEAFGISKDARFFSAENAVGLGVDILLDPLSYLSMGAMAGVQLPTKAGIKTLTPEGVTLLNNTIKEVASGLPKKTIAKRASQLALDARYKDLAPKTLTLIAKNEIGTKTAEKYLSRLAKEGTPEAKRLFDQGGIRYMGKTLVTRDKIAQTYGVGAKIFETVMNKTYVGREIYKFGKEFKTGIDLAFNSMAGKNPVFNKGLAQTYKDLTELDKRDINNGTVMLFSKVKNDQDLFDITRYLDAKTGMREFGDDLAGFTERFSKYPAEAEKVRLETLQAFNRVNSDPALKKMADNAQVQFAKMADAEYRAGTLDSKVSDYFTHLYKNKQAPKTIENYLEQHKPISSNLRFSKERTLPTLMEAKMLGLDPEENIAKIFYSRSVASSQAIRKRELIKATAEQFGNRNMNPQDVMNPNELADFLNENVIFQDKAVGKVYLPRAVVKEMNDLVANPAFDKETSQIFKAYDSVQNLYKTFVTTVSPAYHGRNVIGNVANSFQSLAIHSLHPKSFSETYGVEKLVNTFDQTGSMLKELGDKVMTNKFGQDIPLAQLASEVRLMNQHSFYNAELGQDIWDSITKRRLNIPVKVTKDIGRSIENFSRTQLYINARRQGYTADASRKLVDEFLFDYDNLTSFEKNFMRRVFPFYTWARKNIGLQTKMLLQKPIYASVFGDISNRMKAGLSDKDFETLPEWMKNQPIFFGGKNGDKISAYAGLGIPLAQAIQTVIPNDFSLKGVGRHIEKEVFSQGAFIPKVIAELATGQDFFKGTAIEDNRFMNKKTFKQINIPFLKELLFVRDAGKDYVEIDPYRAKIINALPTARIQNMILDMNAEDKTTLDNILRTMTGIKNYSYSIKSGQAKLDKETQKKLVKMGILAEFVNVYVPKK